MIAIPSHSPAAALALISALAIAGCSACSSAGTRPADREVSGASPAAENPAASEGSQGASGAPPTAAAPSGTPEMAQVPKDAKPMEATVDIKNTIRWSTASEVENFGYDVYRGEAEDGPFVRLTAQPIPGAGTSDEPHKYAYVDKDIDPTKDYWYYVESVSYSGVRERFTPVQKAKAKQPR